MNVFTRQKRTRQTRRTTLFVASVLAVAALIVVVAPGVSYAQFGGLMGAVKGKALEALTNKVMDELEKKFKESVSKQPISEAAKAEIVKKLSDMARPIVKKFIDAAGSGSLPNPADLVKTVLSDVLPRIPELVASAKAEGGGAPVGVTPSPAVAAQYSSPAPAQYAAPAAVPQAAPIQVPPPEKPKIAVYAFGAEDPALNKAMTTRLVIALNNSGRFQAVDSYKELFEQAAETQKGGTVAMNSKQFKKLGEQFGAEHICVAEITKVFGEKQVSAHIMKAGATGIVAIGAADVPLKALIDLTTASEQITDAMFKNINFGSVSDSKARKTDAKTDSKTDNKAYKTVSIGGKTWMAENLNHPTPSGSWCYFGSEGSNCDKYGGRLYDWNTAKSVCPFGWHLPSRQEWSDMIAAAGGSSVAGKKLKSAGGWINSANVNGNSNTSGTNGTDDYGFSALPGGYRANNGGFGNAGNGGNWWTATENGNAYAYAMRMSSYDDSAEETYNYRDYGFSVRCVQD